MEFASQAVCPGRGMQAGVGLGLSQELPYHPNMCSPEPRKAKVCLHVRNKKFLLSEKHFSLRRRNKPGPLFGFQGKNPVFFSFTLAVDKMWVLTNAPQSTVLPPLWCFVVIWLCRSYPSQLRVSPLPQPAFLLQDLFGEMPVDATLQLVPAWPALGRPSSPAQLSWAGEKRMSKPR